MEGSEQALAAREQGAVGGDRVEGWAGSAATSEHLALFDYPYGHNSVTTFTLREGGTMNVIRWACHVVQAVGGGGHGSGCGGRRACPHHWRHAIPSNSDPLFQLTPVCMS